MQKLQADMEQLQASKDVTMHEKERAYKWAMRHLEFEWEFCKVVKQSANYWVRLDEAKSQVVELTQAIEEIAKTATADVESIKELQEINELLLEKDQQNEKLLQRFLMRS